MLNIMEHINTLTYQIDYLEEKDDPVPYHALRTQLNKELREELNNLELLISNI